MSDLASEGYAKQLKQLHDSSQAFGVGNVTAKHYPVIKNLIQKKSFGSVLDYGCGKGHFLQYARQTFPGLRVEGFDVASDEYGVLPDGLFDMVVCLDVMEHVEFGAMSHVLSEIRSRVGRVFVCSVANYPAGKTLPDGRNAHVTQMPFGQWFTIFSTFFRVDQFMRTGKGEGLFICSSIATSADWR
jgi:2-polyprenyl-3-methyl-5-hydroxy-6-metoxy-1,4-benzoquinol methylase